MPFYESVGTYLAELVVPMKSDHVVKNSVEFETSNSYLNYQSLK